MTMNTSYRKLFSRSTAAGLALLLVLTHPLPAAAKIKPDWSKVRAVPLGTPTTVVLYEDQASLGKRQIEGHFRSATAGAITLLLPDGQTRTLEKRTVRKVLVPRPLVKRYQGWITAAISTAIWVPLLSNPDVEIDAWGIPILGAPTVIAFLVAPTMGSIYDVPLKHRDNTAQTPPKRRSDTTAPGVTESGGSPTGSGLVGSFLTEPSGPDLLRQQARQSLVRKGLPLHLPDLPLRLSAEALAQAGDTQTGLDRGFPQGGGASRTDNLD